MSIAPGGVGHEITRGRSDQDAVGGEGYPATTVGAPILIGPQPVSEVLRNPLQNDGCNEGNQCAMIT